MLKFFWKDFWRGDEAAAKAEAGLWRRDPLAHPVLDAMSQRELGDLPFVLPEPTPPAACCRN